MSGINITNCFGLGVLFSSPHRQMKKGCISLGGEDLICFNEHRKTGKIWSYVFYREIILEWKNGLMLFLDVWGWWRLTNHHGKSYQSSLGHLETCQS